MNIELTIPVIAGLGNDEVSGQNCKNMFVACPDLPEYLLQTGTEYMKEFCEQILADDPDASPMDVIPAAMATWYVRLLEVGTRLGRLMEQADNAVVAEFQVPDTLPEDFQ